MSEKTILLVEDDPDQVTLALRALDESGISGEVVTTGDGFEALEYLFGTGRYARRDPRDAPELVLLDVNLPGMTGPEVLKRVRADERTELVPVVLYSSSGEPEDIQEGYRAGANSYITKPADFRAFSEAMCALGWYWLEWNESP
jgi:two-component system response regulator